MGTELKVGEFDSPRNAVVDTKCGRWWKQRGNRTGHCAACHETFEGLKLWDSHQRIARDGTVMCLDPAHMKFRGERLRLVDGTWRGPELASGTFK